MNRPPVVVTLAALLTLWLGLLNIWRAVVLLRQRPMLMAFGAGPELTVVIALAIVAGIALPLLALLVWRRAARASAWLLPALLLYVVAYTVLNGLLFPTLFWHLALLTLALLASLAGRRLSIQP